MIISKKTLEYLAELSRIKIEEKKEEKLLKDLREILNYFEELKESNTENIEPVTGGTNLENVFREDEFIEADLRGKPALSRAEGLIEAFPEKQDGFLKIPPVFE